MPAFILNFESNKFWNPAADVPVIKSMANYIRRSVCAFGFCIAVASHSIAQSAAGASKLRVAPAMGLIDEPLSISAWGLTPNEEVRITATMWEDEHHVLISRAWFRPNDHGAIDLEKQDPVDGSYCRSDMGLLWSMSEGEPPAGVQPPASGFLRPPEPYTVFFELESGGKVVATAQTSRQFMSARVAQIDVHDSGLVGRFFLPSVQKKVPAIMVLGGSEGGLESAQIGAMLLASHGFAALGLAYFRAPGLPEQLVNIPLEYLKRATDWLRSRSEVDGERIGIMGSSRGAELALLTAATFPEIKAVVAYGPSSVVWAGISSSRRDPSWTYKGKPLPFILDAPSDFSKEFDKMRFAAIPVEKINGGVLLISGREDQLWPSSVMADQIVARLHENDFKFPFKQLMYDRAGHLINFPYLPTPSRVSLGGTSYGLAQADADSWPRVLQFIRENLNR